MIAWSLFGLCFAFLLVMSMTDAWTPDNTVLHLASWLLRASGLFALALSILPPFLRLLHRR